MEDPDLSRLPSPHIPLPFPSTVTREMTTIEEESEGSDMDFSRSSSPGHQSPEPASTEGGLELAAWGSGARGGQLIANTSNVRFYQ